MSSPSHYVKSDVTAFRIVQTLVRGGEMRVSDIAEETGIARSAVYKHLDTLRDMGFITKRESIYSLSFRWFEIGHDLQQNCNIYPIARPEVERLSRLTGETVSLVVDEGTDAIYLEQLRANRNLCGPVERGNRLSITTSIGGKAILSFRPDEEVEAILTETDVVDDVDQMLSKLRTLRNQRIVIERGPLQQDSLSAGVLQGHRHEGSHDRPYQNLNSIAAPIRDGHNRAVAAIELSGSQESFYGRRFEEEAPTLLVNAAKKVETKFVQAYQD